MQLLCVGDVALADDGVTRRTWAPPAGVVPGPDSRILFNWELPVGDRINPAPRSSGPRLLARPASPSVIRPWSPGIAALANNHLLDAGSEGFTHTVNALRQCGFNLVGAGHTLAEIRQPLLWTTGEGCLAILNWVFPETHPDWNSIPGPNCWAGLEEARRAVEAARREADWVLAVLHWSDEDFPYPRPEDRATARALAEMGIDVIVGNHPHVVRGMEVFGTCPVFYSVGNFYFSDVDGGGSVQRAPRNREALGIELSFVRGQPPAYRILSFWQIESEVALDPSRRAKRRMQRTSQPLQRLPEPGYSDWYAGERARFDRWGVRLHFALPRLGVRGLVRYGLRKARLMASAGTLSPPFGPTPGRAESTHRQRASQ